MNPPRRPAGSPHVAAPERLDRPFSDPLVQRLFPPLASGVHWGLDRTERALADLGDPHRSFRSVHVGGTNGKGSVASSVHAILQASGLRTGLYTSPHLCSFRERYILDRGPVDESLIEACAREIRDVVVEHGLTFFEAITVLAFQLFRAAAVDVAVVEVGLGGRLDATNVLVPEIAAITNVAMDHAEYLGDTLAEIAREKAGIIKPRVPLVTAEEDAQIRDLLREAASSLGSRFVLVDPAEVVVAPEIACDHTSFVYRSADGSERSLRTPLVGRHQAINAALAVALVEELPPAIRPDPAAIERGLAGVRWPGRDQIEVIRGGTWLFDVAHNVAGVRSLVDTLRRLDLPRPLVAVVGVLGDKDWAAMLPPLLGEVDAAWLTIPPSGPTERRWDPHAAARALGGGSRAEDARPGRLEIDEDFERALGRASEAAGAGTVVVTGSVYTVGSALQALDRVPFPDQP